MENKGIVYTGVPSPEELAARAGRTLRGENEKRQGGMY